MRFEWDPRKARLNLRKHGVSFEEAKTVFDAAGSQLLADMEHSEDENRFFIVGLSSASRLLLVCHCWRGDEVVRIISARKPTSFELLKLLR